MATLYFGAFTAQNPVLNNLSIVAFRADLQTGDIKQFEKKFDQFPNAAEINALVKEAHTCFCDELTGDDMVYTSYRRSDPCWNERSIKTAFRLEKFHDPVDVFAELTVDIKINEWRALINIGVEGDMDNSYFDYAVYKFAQRIKETGSQANALDDLLDRYYPDFRRMSPYEVAELGHMTDAPVFTDGLHEYYQFGYEAFLEVQELVQGGLVLRKFR